MNTDQLSLSETGHVNEWVFKTVRPYVKGRVLEIESAIGTVSTLFIENKLVLHLSNPSPKVCSALREKFCTEQSVRGIHSIDLHDPGFKERYLSDEGTFDTIFQLDTINNSVLDSTIISNARFLLRKDGILIGLIPAPTIWYRRINIELEEGLEELKKYNRSAIKHLLNNQWDRLKTRFVSLPINPKPTSHNQTTLSALVIAQKKDDE